MTITDGAFVATTGHCVSAVADMQTATQSEHLPDRHPETLCACAPLHQSSQKMLQFTHTREGAQGTRTVEEHASCIAPYC